MVRDSIPIPIEPTPVVPSSTTPMPTEPSLGGTPTIFNLPILAANTEVSYPLPADTKKLFVQERSGRGTVKFAFTAAASGTTYITIPRSNWYNDMFILETATLTLYVQCDIITTLEIITWS